MMIMAIMTTIFCVCYSNSVLKIFDGPTLRSPQMSTINASAPVIQSRYGSLIFLLNTTGVADAAAGVALSVNYTTNSECWETCEIRTHFERRTPIISPQMMLSLQITLLTICRNRFFFSTHNTVFLFVFFNRYLIKMDYCRNRFFFSTHNTVFFCFFLQISYQND
jgi:hypothetical protein